MHARSQGWRRQLRKLFFNGDKRLRNGWWVLAFIVFIALTRLVHKPLVDALKASGLHEAWREPLPVLFVLLATWACTRLRREPLSSVGLRLDRRWLTEILVGTGLGIASLALAAAMIGLAGGVHFELDPSRSVGALANGLYVFFFAALLEELLFRGFLFQRLLDGLGVWVTQVSLAALFAFGHWGNPGMEGTTLWLASLDLGLAAVLLGLAYLRTRSLALPIGLHLGWNWAQGQLFGFGVSGHGQHGWLQPVFGGSPTWLSGGEFGPEASVFGVLADLVMIALLWRWKGSAGGPKSLPLPSQGEGPKLEAEYSRP